MVKMLYYDSLLLDVTLWINSILIHEFQYKSTRVNTNQHEFDTNQHESDTNQHESTRV